MSDKQGIGGTDVMPNLMLGLNQLREDLGMEWPAFSRLLLDLLRTIQFYHLQEAWEDEKEVLEDSAGRIPGEDN